MNFADSYHEFKEFMLALALTQPRILGLFSAIPLFSASMLPGMLRTAIAVAIGLMAAPPLMPQVAALDWSAGALVMLVIKEAAVGFVLGCLVAVPFWAFEGIGFLIDNQRGASIAATLNPLTGNDSSPLGILFNQAFVVFFLISGGFAILLELIYASFRLWNVFTWAPHLKPETMEVLIAQIMGLVKLALLLSAPVVIAMFLSEMGLALVSRFVPQLQVFFMAMPIKSAIAMLVLMFYMAMLFEYGQRLIEPLQEIVPTLDSHWRKPPEVAR